MTIARAFSAIHRLREDQAGEAGPNIDDVRAALLLLYDYTYDIQYAQEGSNADIAAELTSLIQTQRAYSSNATVIRTVDEMLQETTNIKR